ncbi:MAG: type II CRISPR-associated endonuclease Cas1 [Ruminococcaceae bacterium]|nr:type II CRISPR-associated endonuclease Cas1 [Oscillospiraceae bacterium]
MAFRNIIIESPANLSVRRSQLIVKTDTEHSVPVEDISAIMLENRQSVITAAALSFLGQSGCALFVCDEKHLPCAVLTPYANHSRELYVLRSQLDASEPLKKRLWQSIVKAKVNNQAQCLRLNGMDDEAERLELMAERVKSGDSENVEATAAQKYFSVLFGKGFARGEEDGRNAALNYGYAILRGSMARYLAVYGFTSAFGLHHRNTLNSFNLADDLMEPFRPVVDMMVTRYVNKEDELTPETKRMLFNCMNLDILSGGQHHSVAYAAERLVQSLSRSFGSGEPKLLLPQLVELKQHSYE